MTYVYLIENTVTGKGYVGCTTRSLHTRWYHHVWEATRRSHNYALHNAIRKYGAEAFGVSMLSKHDTVEAMFASEQYWIAELKTKSPGGYNLTSGGEGNIDPAPETRAKLRAARIGFRLSPESRARMAAKLRGRGFVVTPEWRAKHAAAMEKQRGPLTPEEAASRAAKRRDTLSRQQDSETEEERGARIQARAAAAAKTAAKLKGRPRSAETRAKISASNTGKRLTREAVDRVAAKLRGRKQSPETIAKRAASMRGKRRTEETRARISAAHRGRTYSQEVRARMSAAHRTPEHLAAMEARRGADGRMRSPASTPGTAAGCNVTESQLELDLPLAA